MIWEISYYFISALFNWIVIFLSNAIKFLDRYINYCLPKAHFFNKSHGLPL